jgi:hypothetical protein
VQWVAPTPKSFLWLEDGEVRGSTKRPERSGVARSAWIQAKNPATFDRSARHQLLEPSHPSELRNEQSADWPMPERRRTYALARFPSTPWTGSKGPISTCRQDIGDFSATGLCCLSVRLVDRLPGWETMRRACVVARPPLQRNGLPALGKRASTLVDESQIEGPGLIERQGRSVHRGTTIRSDEFPRNREQRRSRVRNPITGPETKKRPALAWGGRRPLYRRWATERG